MCFTFTQALLSEVELQVDNHINGVYVRIAAICPDGSTNPGQNKCRNVKANETVSFLFEETLCMILHTVNLDQIEISCIIHAMFFTERPRITVD